MKLKYIFLSLALSTSATLTTAQDYDLGISGGFSYYMGDLSPGLSNGIVNAGRGLRPSIGGLARYNFTPHFSLRGSLTLGYVAAYDKFGNKGTSREDRNLSFHSPIVEAAAIGEVNFMKYIAGSRKYKFAPFAYLGVGLTYMEPRAWLDGDRIKLRKLATEPGKSYSPIQVVVPVGLGIKWNVKENWTLTFEGGWRKMFTDYLDDVSTGYMPSAYTVTDNSAQSDRLSNRSGKTVGPTSLRGNSNYNDNYFIFGVTIYKTIRPYSCR